MTELRPTTSEETLGGLVHRLSEQIPQLVRSEVRLAQLELTEKGKRAGIGLGMFSAAGLLAFFGLSCLVTAAIFALALALPGWAAALVVGAAMFVLAGAAAFFGKSRVQAATPVVPEHAITGVRMDLHAMKGGRE